ncbi:unnamed protein product [Rotaria sp. Silwood1]|nr:unnamed protein product [Rotaria sp. Silwood1]
MMIFIGLLFILIHSINSQQLYECDFDYEQKCLLGLPSISFILLNETSDEPQQPVSDVSAIKTSNDIGECFFPFQYNSFDMFFCEKTDPNLPSTCPTLNANGPRINCTEGEYGYEKFEIGQIGSRSYKLDLTSDLSYGEHCIRFYYYLSNNYSNGSINVIVEDSQSNQNQTVVIAYLRLENRWHEIRENFYIENENPTIYFLFTRESSLDLDPFYLAIDDITIIDVECEPIITTTISTSQHIISTTPTTTTTRETSITITTSTILSSTTTIISTNRSTSSPLTSSSTIKTTPTSSTPMTTTRSTTLVNAINSTNSSMTSYYTTTITQTLTTYTSHGQTLSSNQSK